MLRTVFAAFAFAFAVIAMQPAEARDLENTLYIELKDGRVVIEMRPDLAPQHVERIKQLARDGFYDGVVFHRVIDGFMAQTGDGEFGNKNHDYNLARAGTGGSSYPDLPAEFSQEPHVEGVASMARAQNPNSANSQFFICLADARFLDGQYTVWGKVVEGMDHVHAIKKGDSNQNGSVTDPDIMISVKVAADVEK